MDGAALVTYLERVHSKPRLKFWRLVHIDEELPPPFDQLPSLKSVPYRVVPPTFFVLNVVEQVPSSYRRADRCPLTELLPYVEHVIAHIDRVWEREDVAWALAVILYRLFFARGCEPRAPYYTYPLWTVVKECLIKGDLAVLGCILQALADLIRTVLPLAPNWIIHLLHLNTSAAGPQRQSEEEVSGNEIIRALRTILEHYGYELDKIEVPALEVERRSPERALGAF